MSESFVNISAYRFVPLEDIVSLREKFLPYARELNLKGTVLLSHEGINMFVAGTRHAIDQWLDYVNQWPAFVDLPVKESLSDHQPFSRMLVRLKKEIISMGVESIVPSVATSPKLKAAELKQWLDEGRDITLLDVRNDYEIEVGTFDAAVPVGVDHFRKFPDAVREMDDAAKKKPVVMFCTGGIRCEKAGPLMEKEGFDQVFQLDGGILKYFEEVGGDHYHGDCFVFDKRVAVNPALAETDHAQCYACQRVLSREDQQSPFYRPPHSCEYCYTAPEHERETRLSARHDLIREKLTPLPGSVEYENVRPMNVPLRFDDAPLLDFLTGMHAHLDEAFWRPRIESGRVRFKEQRLTLDTKVRAGWRVEHHVEGTTEPAVSNDLSILLEDEAIVAINKPAPLPMHPCGRYNRNSLSHFLSLVYQDIPLRHVHRLDANTTGCVVYATRKRHASYLTAQFKQGKVLKTYLAKVAGVCPDDEFSCDLSISDTVSVAGSRTVADDGQKALTHFRVVQRCGDGTTVLECQPVTGRTNQIRLHLAALQLPIVGDPVYGGQGNVPDAASEVDSSAVRQTLAVDDPPMCLHAWKIKLTHPVTKAPLEIEAQPPAWYGKDNLQYAPDAQASE